MAQTVCVLLSALERHRLEAIASDRNQPGKYIERARVGPASANGRPMQQVATELDVSRPMVWRWQQRFAKEGPEGLLRDKTRKPGKPPIVAETVARVVALTCGELPCGATHWTGRSMAKTAGISLRSVQRIWQAHQLQPHRVRSFKRSRDPRFAQRHRHEEFIRFLNTVERDVPAGKVIHAIVDNDATHKHPKVKAWLARHPRWTFHFTPTSGSWLNAVETFFSALTRQRIRRGSFHSIVNLQTAIKHYLAERHAEPRPFVWTVAAASILAKIARLPAPSV